MWKEVFVFTLCCLIGASLSDHVPDNYAISSKRCSEGQEFWCQSLKNSANCNATRFCIESVWTKHVAINLKKSDENLCDLCKQMVSNAREQLNSNQTRAEMEQVIIGACKIYTRKSAKLLKKCERIFTEYMDNAIDILNSQMDPDVVCRVSHLCVYEANNEICTECKKFTGGLLSRFDKSKREQRRVHMQSVLKELCLMTTDWPMRNCNLPIRNYANNMLYFIRENLDNGDLCHTASMCSVTAHSSSLVSRLVPQHNEKKPCTMCKEIVRRVVLSITRNSTEEEMKVVLERICTKMIHNSGKCSHIIDKYFATILNTMTQEELPDLLCTLLMICDQEGIYVDIMGYKKQYEIYNKDKVLIMDDRLKYSLVDELFEPTPEQEILSNERHLELTLDEILFELSGNSSSLYFGEKDSEKALLSRSRWPKIDDEITSSTTRKPIDFGDPIEGERNLPLTRFIVGSKFSPNIPIFLSKDVRNQEESANVIPKSKKDCVMCMFIVTSLKNHLESNGTVEMVKHFVNNVCHSLKIGLQADCLKMADKLTEERIRKILSDIDSHKICKELEACESLQSSTTDIVRVKSSSDCDICLKIVGGLVRRKSDESMDFADVKSMKQVCVDWLFSLEQKCEEYIEAYGISFGKQIMRGEMVESICVNDGLCAREQQLLGANGCTWGPVYQLSSIDTAIECDMVPEFLKKHNLLVGDGQ